MLVSNRGLICHQLLLLSPFIISALIAVAAVNTTPHEVTDLVWMELSSGPPHQRGLTTAGSGRAPPLHTARKRSKASLASLAAAGEGQGSYSQPDYSETGSAQGASSSTVIYTTSTGRVLGPEFTNMLPSSSEPRIRTPYVNQGSKSSSWQIAGHSVDYALDWALVVVVGVVLAASEAGIPREAYMRKADLSHTAYPLLPNSVPAWSVPLCTLVVPAVLFALHSVVLRRPLLESHHLILGVWTAVLFTAAVTNIIKCPVGRLRPDFNARCWPDGKVVWAKEDELGGYPLCSGPVGSVTEGRKSFPSGHSSWSAAGLCFITWWLLDRLRVFDGSGHTWRLLAAVIPAMAAVAVGVSRYVDYWHHASDVAAGLALGAFVSWVCYRQQRGRLADIDPASYGGSSGSGNSAAGVGGWPSAADISRGAGDGTPLLYTAPQHHFDLQQPQQALPV